MAAVQVPLVGFRSEGGPPYKLPQFFWEQRGMEPGGMVECSMAGYDEA